MRPRTYFMMIFAIIVLSIVGAAIWSVREYLPTLGVFMLVILGLGATTAIFMIVILLFQFATKMQKYDVGMHGSFLVRYNKIIPIAPMRDSELVQMLPGNLIQPPNEEVGDYEDEAPEDVTISEEIEYEQQSIIAKGEPRRLRGPGPDETVYQSTPLLDAAVRMYRAGNKGRATLAKSLGIGENEARKLLTELRRQGRIE